MENSEFRMVEGGDALICFVENNLVLRSWLDAIFCTVNYAKKSGNGMMEYWNVGMLECWNAGFRGMKSTLKRWHGSVY